MSELATLARPYAAAVFKQAKEAGTMEDWSNTLAFLAKIMADPAIKSAAGNPKLGRHAFSQLLVDSCGEGLSKQGKNLIFLLSENGKLPLAGHIAELFEQYRAEEAGVLDAQVVSAFPLDDAESKKLAKTLQKALGKKVRLDVSVDRSLIGGVLVRAGDKVIDGSIKGQLKRLARRLDS
jgi:F-type H+-transporting ATPase subunit delta